jgi:hypothetical protein
VKNRVRQTQIFRKVIRGRRRTFDERRSYPRAIAGRPSFGHELPKVAR